MSNRTSSTASGDSNTTGLTPQEREWLAVLSAPAFPYVLPDTGLDRADPGMNKLEFVATQLYASGGYDSVGQVICEAQVLLTGCRGVIKALEDKR